MQLLILDENNNTLHMQQIKLIKKLYGKEGLLIILMQE